MSEAGAPARGRLRAGSPHKRAAIVRAALDVFLRDGYARASVDAIAAQAGVSKRTIYDYYGDKRSLFLAAVDETRTVQESAFAELLDRTLGAIPDSASPDSAGPGGAGRAEMEAALHAFGREFTRAVAHSPERAAVLRLVSAEAPHFAELRRQWRPAGPVQRTLADRLAGLAAAGLLDIDDPERAAEYLGVLLVGPLNNRSLFGAITVDDDEVDRIAADGVRVFLRAFAFAR